MRLFSAEKIRIVAAMGLLLLTTGSLMVGCGNKDAATATAPAAGGTAAAPAVASTPTPEQEAAKQKAIQEGPAIQAALEAQQRGAPAPK